MIVIFNVYSFYSLVSNSSRIFIVIFDLVVVFPPRAIRVNAMNKESS